MSTIRTHLQSLVGRPITAYVLNSTEGERYEGTLQEVLHSDGQYEPVSLWIRISGEANDYVVNVESLELVKEQRPRI